MLSRWWVAALRSGLSSEVQPSSAEVRRPARDMPSWHSPATLPGKTLPALTLRAVMPSFARPRGHLGSTDAEPAPGAGRALLARDQSGPVTPGARGTLELGWPLGSQRAIMAGGAGGGRPVWTPSSCKHRSELGPEAQQPLGQAKRQGCGWAGHREGHLGQQWPRATRRGGRWGLQQSLWAHLSSDT